MKKTMHARRSLMRGVAAIEFALVTTVFCFLIYTVATFGVAFYTQQVVSRAAEDGVRASLIFNNVVANDVRVQNAIYQSLLTSLITPLDATGTPDARLQWLKSTVAAPEINTSVLGMITVKVVYPYRSNPAIAPIPLAQGLMPDLLIGSATAAKLD